MDREPKGSAVSAKPLLEDVLVNSGGFWARAQIAISMNDPEAAMDLLRDMLSCEGKIYLTIIRPQGVVPRLALDALATAGKPLFRGRPMHSKFPGRCAVCGVGFGVDAAIIYNGDQKRAAHDQCGEVDE